MLSRKSFFTSLGLALLLLATQLPILVTPAVAATNGGLLNPGFENGTANWMILQPVADTVVVVGAEGPSKFPTYLDMNNVTVLPFKGSSMLRLGAPRKLAENQKRGTNAISQNFTANRNTLRFAFRLFSWEHRGVDSLRVELKDLDNPTAVFSVTKDDGSPLVLKMQDGTQIADNTTPIVFTLDVGKRGQWLDSGWVKVRINGIPTGHRMSLTYSLAGTDNDAHPTWVYFDNVNDPPVASDQSVTTDEDIAKAITLVATDIDGDPLTYSIVTPPSHGTLTGTLPNITYLPVLNYNGLDSFTFKANDGELDSNIATVSITIIPVNDPPVASDQSVTTDEDIARAITLVATDVDGDPLTYSIVTPTSHGTLTGILPNITYTPALNYHGSDNFTFKANDGQVDSNIALVSITINSVNDPPVAQFQFSPEIPWEGDIIEFIDQSSDVDIPDDHIAAWLWKLYSPATDETAFSDLRNPFLIPSNQGLYEITLTVTDSFGATGNQTVTVEVGNAPPAVNALNIEVLSGQAAGLYGRFIDPGWKDTHSATWSVNGITPAASVQEDNLALMGTGIVTGTVPAVTGSLTGTLAVSDNAGASSSDNFTITAVADNPSRHESNNTVGSATVLASDAVHLSYIQSAGDVDVFRLVSADGNPLPTSSEVLVTLRGLPADYDMVLLASQPSALEPGGFQMGGYQMGGFQMGGYQMGGYQMGGFQMGGYQMGGYQMGAFQMGGYQMGGFQMGGFQRAAYQMGGFQMGGYQMGGFQMGAYQMGGYQMGGFQMGILEQYPLSQIGFTGLAVVSQDNIGGSDISLAELGLSLADLGSIEGQNISVVGFSANRGQTDEVLLAQVNTADTQLFIVVLGPNGTHSNLPYLLQIETSRSLNLAQLLGDQGNYAPPVTNWSDDTTALLHTYNGSPKTLFVTQRERLIGRYGQQEWETLLASLEALANHPDVAGNIISLPISAYQGWDYQATSSNGTIITNYSSVDAANEVTLQIRDIIRQNLSSDTQYIVIVGNDDIVPFHRVPDETGIGNERQYALSSYLRLGSPLFYSVLEGFILTDDYFVDEKPISWQGRSLYIPDIAVARLVEKPAEIRAIAEAFMASDGILNPTTALVTGYDFFNDGAQAVIDTLAGAGITADSLTLPELWNAEQLRSSFLGEIHGINNINAHYTHYSAVSASGFNSGNFTDVLTSTQVSNAWANLLNSIIFSMGCHAGLNVPDEAAPGPEELGLEIDPRLDFPQAMYRSIYVASTGFGYGDDEGIGGTERLMGIFTEKLMQTDNASVGQALVNAKQSYLSSLSAMTAYDEKSSIQFTLYGLPQYRITTGLTGQPVTSASSSGLTLTLTLIDGSNITTSTYPLQEVVTSSGSYFTANGDAQATAGRPVQPRVVLTLPNSNSMVHGVRLVDSGFSEYSPFDPVITRPTNEWELNATEIQLLPPTFWPAELASINNLETGGQLIQTLVIIPGQFRPTSGTQPVTGTERLYTNLTFELLRSATATTDYQPPTVSSIDLSASGNTSVTVTVGVSDPSGIARIIVLTTHSGNATATSLNLPHLPQNGQFTLTVPYTSGDQLVIQIVDGAGNVASFTGKGANMSVVPVNAGPDLGYTVGMPVNFKAVIANFSSLTAPVSFIWKFGDGAELIGRLAPEETRTVDVTIDADGNGIFVVQHTYNTDSAPLHQVTANLKITDANGGIGTDAVVVRHIWDPQGDTVATDADLIVGGYVINNTTSMTITIPVAGAISTATDRQYRIKLFSLVDGSTIAHLRYDSGSGKSTGLPSLQVTLSSDGKELRYTFNLTDIGKAKGDYIGWAAETQDGVKATEGVGKVDNMPDSGLFGYLIW